MMTRHLLRRCPWSQAVVTSSAIAVLLVAAQALAMHPNHPLGFRPERAYQAGVSDQVDLYSGTVSLTIPIGPFLLVYNSQVWMYEYDQFGEVQARPDYSRNAGIGWRLGWGEIFHWNHHYNQTGGRWLFIDQAGTRHEFWDNLHQDEDDGDGDVFYTRDNSYLRLIKQDGATIDIEFPDGSTRRYKNPGGSNAGRWRLKRGWSRFGSASDWDFDVTYNQDFTEWTWTDRYQRSHVVRLEDGHPYISRVVTQIDVAAFNGQRALYDFAYQDRLVDVSCKDSSDNTPPRISVPHLLSIDLPDGTSYEMSEYYNLCGQATPDDLPGILKEIQLPTGGSLAWDFQNYQFPASSEPVWDTSAGVETKYTKLANGNTEGTWTYKSTRVPASGGFDAEMETEVVYPTGDCSKHHFNARSTVTPSKGWEIGLPFSYRNPAGTSPERYLSAEIWDASSGKSCSGSKLRSTYLLHDKDKLPGTTAGQAGYAATNRRVKGSRTVFHDDSDNWIDSVYSQFDGIGHFRKVATTGSLWATTNQETRAVTTNYNRVSGNYPGNNPPAVTDPWVLNVFDYVHTWEPDAEGKKTSRVYYTFDDDTGFLECTRVLETGSNRGPNDVLTEYLPDSLGLVTEVKRYGGDLQVLPTGTGCDKGTLQPEYWTKYTYENGVRKTSRPYEPDGTPGPFFTYDVDLDFNTGLVTGSRDSALFLTTFDYDTSGRPTQVTPQEGAKISYSYVNPTGTAGAEIHIDLKAEVGGTVLTSSEVHLDAFGRAWNERRWMPDSTWSETQTVFNSRGWVEKVTERGYLGRWTTFSDFDPFGRPGKITPPDGKDLLFSYLGVRKVTSQAKIQLATGETYVPTTREYDAYGRLRKVIEPSSAQGTNVPTTYEYDVGNRLTEIFTDAYVDQTRSFNYDTRGFMLSETHPEKGASGNGDVDYLDYDSTGLAHRVTDGPNDLSYEYDFMGRLTAVKDLNASSAVLTSLQYDDPGPGYGTGKLWKAVQHNRLGLPWSEFPLDDVIVTETYTYQGKAGAVSARNTSIQGLSLAVGAADPSFDVSYTYDDLGNPSKVSYPTCTNPNCSATVLTGRDVDYVYDQGLLSKVVGWTSATPISYHKNGAFWRIKHSNGVDDVQTLDPNVKSRPQQIRTENTPLGQGFTTGLMSYDGAGNITEMDRVSAGVTNTFAYDKVSRLVSASFEGWLEDYDYDVYGNITRVETTPPGGPMEVYDPTIVTATNRIQEGVGVDYDAAGNLTLSLSYSYDWNPLNQLERQVNASNRRWFHIYTAGGERLVTVDWWEGVPSRQTVFTLRGLDNKVLSSFELVGLDELSGWSRKRDYIYAGSRLLASDDESGSGEVHYHLDHLGTPRLLTDSTGARISAHDFLPYGEEITSPGTEVMKFTGHERDLDTGHDYMHARYYHEYLGRFLGVDPVLGSADSPQSWNRFSYVNGNPLILVDPSGMVDVEALLKSAMDDPRFRWGLSLGASVVADYAAENMEPGYPRAAVNALAALLAAESAAQGAMYAGAGAAMLLEPIPDPTDTVTRSAGATAVVLGTAMFAVSVKVGWDAWEQATADFQAASGGGLITVETVEVVSNCDLGACTVSTKVHQDTYTAKEYEEAFPAAKRFEEFNREVWSFHAVINPNLRAGGSPIHCFASCGRFAF